MLCGVTSAHVARTLCPNSLIEAIAAFSWNELISLSQSVSLLKIGEIAGQFYLT